MNFLWLLVGLGLGLMAADYPGFFREISERSEACEAFTIGKPANGQDIWGMRICPNYTDVMLPKIKIVGQIHGDEPHGRGVLMHLIEYLCLQSGGVDSGDIYVIPSLNVDGHQEDKRENANGVDLNRNFPDSRFPARVQRPIQPETRAYMDFSAGEAFTLGLSFHTGALVCCVPWNSGPRVHSRDPQPTEDDSVFLRLADRYVSRHQRMRTGTRFPGGIVNGAEWYVSYGGLVDWDYGARGCNSLTIEICRDCDMSPFFYWEENKGAILSFLGSVNHNRAYGILQTSGGDPIVGHRISIKDTRRGHSFPVYTGSNGLFGKILTPGQYQLDLYDTLMLNPNFTVYQSGPGGQENNVFLGTLIK